MQCLDGKLMAEEKLSLYCALGTPLPAAINPASPMLFLPLRLGCFVLWTHSTFRRSMEKAARIQARSPC